MPDDPRRDDLFERLQSLELRVDALVRELDAGEIRAGSTQRLLDAFAAMDDRSLQSVLRGMDNQYWPQIFAGLPKPVIERFKRCVSKNAWTDAVSFWRQGWELQHDSYWHAKTLRVIHRLEMKGQILLEPVPWDQIPADAWLDAEGSKQLLDDLRAKNEAERDKSSQWFKEVVEDLA